MSVSIKLEDEQLLCYGCLSRDRKTESLRGDLDLIYNLLGSDSEFVVYGSNELQFCWECRATIRRIKQFRTQLIEAQNKLWQFVHQLNTNKTTLSKLKITKNDYYDHEFVFNKNETNKKLFNNDIKNITTNNDITINILKNNTKVEINDVQEDFISYNDAITNDDKKNVLQFDITNTNEMIAISNDNYDIKDKDIFIKIYDMKNVLQNNDISKTNYMVSINNDADIGNDELNLNDIKIEPNSTDYENNKKTSYNPIKITKTFTKYKSELVIDWKNVSSYFEVTYLTEREIDEYNNRQIVTLKWIKCKKCSFKYSNIDMYYRHFDLNHYDKNASVYKCSKCKKIFETIDDLKQHWSHDHKDFYKCKLCGDFTGDYSFIKHLRMEHSWCYKCNECLRQFGSKNKFEMHYKDHTKFICDTCDKTLPSKNMLIKHLKYKHHNTTCTVCNKSFCNYQTFKTHTMCYHPELLNIKVDKDQAYCVECDIQYPSIKRYQLHLKKSTKHVPKEPSHNIPCPECNKIFSRKICMKRHYSKFHTGRTKYHCAICDKYFVASMSLKRHNESVHLKIPKPKDKICDLCGRGFSKKEKLDCHRRTHTGERPYKCSYCSACFAQRTAMISHQKTRHKDMMQIN